MLLPSALQRPSGMVLGAFLPAAPALRGTGPSSVNRTARLRIDTRWKDFRPPRQQGLNGDRDHHSRHHFGGRPNGVYYIYPYNPYSYGWTYRYYPVPRYSAPTYWYYCRSYAAYYPHVGSCPEPWVPVPAS